MRGRGSRCSGSGLDGDAVGQEGCGSRCRQMGNPGLVISLDRQLEDRLLARKLVPIFVEVTGHRGVPRWVTEEDSQHSVPQVP